MTSHHVILRHTTWHYVTQRDMTSQNVKWSETRVTRRHTTLNDVKYVKRRQNTSQVIKQRYMTSYHVTLRYATWHYVTQRDMTSQNVKWSETRVTRRHTTLNDVKYAKRRQNTSHVMKQRYMTSKNVTWRHTSWHYVTQRDINLNILSKLETRTVITIGLFIVQKI